MLDYATSTHTTTVQYLYKNWNFIEVYKYTCFFCGCGHRCPSLHILESLKTQRVFEKNLSTSLEVPEQPIFGRSWWLSAGWHSSLPCPPVLHVIYFPFFMTIRRLRFTLADSTRSSRHPFSGSSTPFVWHLYTRDLLVHGYHGESLGLETHVSSFLRANHTDSLLGPPFLGSQESGNSGVTTKMVCLWCHWDIHHWHVLSLTGPLWAVTSVVFWLGTTFAWRGDWNLVRWPFQTPVVMTQGGFGSGVGSDDHSTVHDTCWAGLLVV